MPSNLVFAVAFAVGIVAGLRAITAPMVASWAAHLGWIDLQGTRLAFMGSFVTAVVFSVLALAEIVNDKLPHTGARTAPPSLIIRITMGAFAAAALCLGSGASPLLGVVLGAVGAVVGTFGGYQVRTKTVKALHSPDFVIALLEDLVAVGGGLFLASRL